MDKIGNAKYVTKFDLLKGFWQVYLTDRAKEVSAFIMPNGLYQYKLMPLGMKNSPVIIQLMVLTKLYFLKRGSIMCREHSRIFKLLLVFP